ncbi:MAG: SPOR domain-containing protein [Spirochaetales bacterium]|nr:SPOR domain-containing protein [Spirochaetales bacterium]
METYDQAVRWLERNLGSPEFGTVLADAISLAPSVGETENLLDTHLPEVADHRQRGTILLRAGVVYELTNRYGRARQLYAQAFDEDPTLWEAMIRDAALALETGDIEAGVSRLTTVINLSAERSTQRRAALLRARALHLNGDTQRAFNHARALAGYTPDAPSERAADPSLVEPETLFLLYELAVALDEPTVRDWTARSLDNPSRLSPEATLIDEGSESPIRFLPSPSRLFGAAPPPPERSTEEPRMDDAAAPHVTGVQTGSFRNAENARYMVEDIVALGFEAEVRDVQTDSGTFYRVVVPLPPRSDVEDTQQLVVTLKERGIEGFLIFGR